MKKRSWYQERFKSKLILSLYCRISIYYIYSSLLTRSRINPKRKVLDNGFLFTP